MAARLAVRLVELLAAAVVVQVVSLLVGD
jgi:hypothetical protein